MERQLIVEYLFFSVKYTPVIGKLCVKYLQTVMFEQRKEQVSLVYNSENIY